MVPNGENSLRRRSSSRPSSRFFTYRLTPCCTLELRVRLISRIQINSYLCSTNTLALETFNPRFGMAAKRAFDVAVLWAFVAILDQTRPFKLPLWYHTEFNYFEKVQKINQPGIWSCDLVSFAQICAWVRSGAPLSSVRDPHTLACHSVLYHSCHRQPTIK